MKSKVLKQNGKKQIKCNAYLTVCLALSLTLVISLCLTLIEGARRNAGKLEAECIAEIAMESIMAEYHRELMKQYNLFAIDSSYGTGICGIENVEEHLKTYLEKNLDYDNLFLSNFFYRDFLNLRLKELKMTHVSMITDYEGAVLRRAAVDAIKEEIGLGLLDNIQQWMRDIEVNGLENSDEVQKKKELDQEIARYDGTEVKVNENVTETVSVVNPTALIEERRKMGILRQIAPEETFSRKLLVKDSLIEDRMNRKKLNIGNMIPEWIDEKETLIERFLFQEYLLKYMGHYGREKSEGALDYQIEYLIGNKEVDLDNLRMIANRICVIREAANTIYLMGCEEKRESVKLLSQVTSALITMPQLAPLLETAIILGWAYAESVYDVQTLLAGGKIPLLKSDKDWHCGLTVALAGTWGEQSDENEGLSYEDYLRVFMMFQDVDNLTVRAMNIMEADIRRTLGNECFRLDACYVAVASDIVIQSEYGYQYELKCKKRY